MASRVPAPITHYADPAQMADWLETANPRAVLIYASGPNLNGGKHPAAALARDWASQREVALFSVPSSTRAGCSDYCAKRLTCSPVAPAASDSNALPARWEDGPEGAVFRLLKRMAEQGQRCPSHTQIAELVDLPDRQAARYRFAQLVKWGLIRVIAASPFTGRVIEIVPTGMRTTGSNQPSGDSAT